jgi:hypothetical protein
MSETPLWSPNSERAAVTNMTAFRHEVERRAGRALPECRCVVRGALCSALTTRHFDLVQAFCTSGRWSQYGHKPVGRRRRTKHLIVDNPITCGNSGDELTKTAKTPDRPRLQ